MNEGGGGRLTSQGLYLRGATHGHTSVPEVGVKPTIVAFGQAPYRPRRRCCQ
jgi:hypothetical protein